MKNKIQRPSLIFCLTIIFLFVGCTNGSMDSMLPQIMEIQKEQQGQENERDATVLEKESKKDVYEFYSQTEHTELEMLIESDNGDRGSSDVDGKKVINNNKITITVGVHILTATLTNNFSSDVLKEHLEAESLTVNLRDYGGFEKVGTIGIDIPSNDENITTSAGDFVLYAGDSLVIFLGSNSWNYTPLGRIDNMTEEELREIFGSGNVTATLSLPE